jgi:hypothetical protein
MTQQSLFGDLSGAAVAETTPYVKGSETSKAAAEKAAKNKDILREKVYAFIDKQGPHGATDQEVEAGTGIPGNTVRPRRGELAKRGRVVKTDRKRPTASGSGAGVWVAARFAEG